MASNMCDAKMEAAKLAPPSVCILNRKHMKKILSLLALTAIIGRSCFADSNEWQTTSLTYSNPVLSEIGTDAPAPDSDKLIKIYTQAAQDYEQNPGEFRVEELFGVARGYLAQKKYNQAIPLYTRFLTVQPTNTIALRELGICYLYAKQFNYAAIEFKKAWVCGDDVGLRDLAEVYYIQSRYSDMKPWVPDLIKLRDRLPSSADKHEIVAVLIVYSLNAEPAADKETFLKAIDGLNDEFFLEREDTAEIVIKGLKAFGYQERADKLAAEMKKSDNQSQPSPAS
jgi:tetratricopeptide (TPR) repeat protein